ncbi:MAG: hypothetical protein EPN53_16410 [Acidobacteria bacterium]|nr:MAG: hypothetical protein EPN53_16410 [Acidobacteriota bacterium]
MVRGPWSVVRGPWSVVRGPWSVVRGPWPEKERLGSGVRGPWSMVRGPWCGTAAVVPGGRCPAPSPRAVNGTPARENGTRIESQ